MAKSANTPKTGKRKAPSTAWKPGQSGNPAGAPKRGESWAELIKRIGELTPVEAAERCVALAQQFLKYGNGATLKETVALRVYASLLFEPQPGLLNAFMERAEGKVAQPVSMEPSAALLAKLEQLGLTLNDVRNDPLAVELFRLAGIDVIDPAAGTDRGE
jgi:hypothetical protein